MTVDNNAATGVKDLAGNVVSNTTRTATFTGYQSSALNVTDGANDNNAVLYVNGATTNSTMQQFRMVTTSGSATVTQVVVAKAGAATVTLAHLYVDNGSVLGAWDATDVQVGGAGTSFSGNTATFTVSESVGTSGKNYIVTYAISNATTDGQQVTSQVTGVTAGSTTVNNTSTVSRAASMDKTQPTSAVSSSGYVTTSDPVVISGTASDTAGTNNSGLAQVEVSVRNGASGNYWNGSSFGSASEAWNTASGTTSWSLTFSPGLDNVLKAVK